MVLTALDWARRHHAGQARKYTEDPYIVHPIAVWGGAFALDMDDESQCAALMHDLVEDCGVTLEEIDAEFGSRVCFLVEGLTDLQTPEDGNRAERKQCERRAHWQGPPMAGKAPAERALLPVAEIG